MIISHEVPKTLLHDSLYFNDYDYFLIHLIKKYNEYMNHFHKCKKLNRFIILDNSACELRGKQEFDFDEFADYIEVLKPNEYLIPDVFNDYEKNIEYFEKWLKYYDKLPGKKIVTLHGKNEDEIIKSYKYFSHYNVKIAINFDECIYTHFNYDDNISLNKMLNRIHLINKLIYKDIINYDLKHHILGCHLPQEFKLYKNFHWIESIDTSNPIMAGLEKIKYNENGLLNKPSLNIDNSQNITLNDDIMSCILHNIHTFRSFCC